MSDAYVFQRFQGTGVPPPGGQLPERREPGSYLAHSSLVTAVNTALAAEQPLLVTGEPGVGKTALAEAIAIELGLGEVLEFHTRSDSQARDLLYRFDSLRRLYDAQTDKQRAEDPKNYRTFVALGLALQSRVQRVVLIDEIDKAPRDFPNDLLNTMDRMEFEVPETGELVRRPPGAPRPVVLITSNAERPLPDPFLRRCVFHRIGFPEDRLQKILEQRLGDQDRYKPMYQAALRRFLQLRDTHGSRLSRAPAIGELLVWVRVLLRSEYGPEALAQELPFPGALLKTAEDIEQVLDAKTRT